MKAHHADYGRFLERLKSYERLEPFPRSRGVEKLAGVKRLAEALDHPERACRVVHVAGTNGKGMTSAMIAALLQRAGRRTGLYTSPHVADIRERISLDGAPVAEDVFARAGHRVLDVADRLRDAVHFSYFDLLTLTGLDAFRAEAMEWAVLETGLGGLSDATNIAPKALCVLTRIGMDHLHVLGNTREEIAAQKLGIVTPGTPTVLAEQPEGLEPWLTERLAALHSPVLRAADFSLRLASGGRAGLELCWLDGEPLGLEGVEAATALTAPKLACAANALAAAETLLGPAAGGERERRLRAVLSVHMPGRLELRRRQGIAGREGPPLETVVLDGGHNAGAVMALTEQLYRWGISGYTLILSLQGDKLVAPLEQPLAGLLAGARRILTLAPQTVRAPASETLTAYLEALLPRKGAAPSFKGPHIEVLPGPREALAAAAEHPDRPVVIAGSFWMLGEVLHLLRDAPPQ